MSSAGWARWRAAEERLAKSGGGGGDALDAAASELPKRQAWILRATAALERADREALEALVQTAPDADLRAVAMLALSDPGDYDATQWRARLKRSGVVNAPLPRLDLLRLACVAHNRDEPTRPQSLAKAARTRPVLDSALMVLSRRFRSYHVDDDLVSRSPRLASFWAAGIAQHLSGTTVREYVRDHMPSIEPLPLESWPDLDESFERRRGSAGLQEFLEDPCRQAWSDVCEAQVAVIASRGEEAVRLKALGALLDAIHATLLESAPPAAAPLVEAALHLVQHSPEIPKREALRRQLVLLDMRLAWASGNDSGQLLETVWLGVQHLSHVERIRCARTLLERANGAPLPRSVRAEILAHAVQGDADVEREVLPWLLHYGADVDKHAFQSALRDAPAAERDRLSGYLLALQGSTVEACGLAARLLRSGALEDASRMALLALGPDTEQPRSRRGRRHFGRALIELAHAAAESPTPPRAGLMVALISTAGSLDDPAYSRELLELLVPCSMRSLELAYEPRYADLLVRLQLMTLLGLDDKAQAAYREFGRWLRRARPEEAIPSALELCASLVWGDESSLRDEDERSAPTDPRPGWLRAITSWLDQEDSGTVGAHAVRLGTDDPVVAESLTAWHMDVSNLEDHDTWDSLEELAVRAHLGQSLEEFLELTPFALDDSMNPYA